MTDAEFAQDFRQGEEFLVIGYLSGQVAAVAGPILQALVGRETKGTGAHAFAERGCVYCHGGPGAQWAKFSEGLNPDPPDLKDAVGELEPRELFWVVKNGIKMTGMPSFGLAGASDQQIWTIVAFIKKLPSISDADYKAWTAAP